MADPADEMTPATGGFIAFRARALFRGGTRFLSQRNRRPLEAREFGCAKTDGRGNKYDQSGHKNVTPDGRRCVP